MGQISQEKMQQQFKMINYMGLAMISAVFIYAAIVLGIMMGYIPLRISRTIDIGVLNKFKYILLSIAIMFYFIMQYIHKATSNKSPNNYIIGKLVIWALCEAVALYGLVLFILSQNSTDFFIFMAISFFYFYIFYPKYSDYERLCNQSLSAPSN